LTFDGILKMRKWFMNHQQAVEKLRLPFDKLRANGACIEFVRIYPFVVSLSNHKKTFSTT
jgi:hypothetical protein